MNNSNEKERIKIKIIKMLKKLGNVYFYISEDFQMNVRELKSHYF